VPLTAICGTSGGLTKRVVFRAVKKAVTPSNQARFLSNLENLVRRIRTELNMSLVRTCAKVPWNLINRIIWRALLPCPRILRKKGRLHDQRSVITLHSKCYHWLSRFYRALHTQGAVHQAKFHYAKDMGMGNLWQGAGYSKRHAHKYSMIGSVSVTSSFLNLYRK
jgi:hypothetical protein